MIPVTKSFLPPIEQYTAEVLRAFNNGWLTNRGELVLELEAKLRDYLKLESSKLLLTNNGTTPLQIALKLLGNGGEVITTPFSMWQQLRLSYGKIVRRFLSILTPNI